MQCPFHKHYLKHRALKVHPVNVYHSGKISHVYVEKSLLYTSGREDPISSKVSKSQNFTVLSAEPEKNIVCYKFRSNEEREFHESGKSEGLTRNLIASHSDIRKNEVDIRE